MKLSLIEYLVCPNCRGILQCVIDQEDKSLPWTEIMEGCLTCKECEREYRICQGVPRMMNDQLPGEVQNTVRGFGFEWTKFNNQIQDTYMTDKVHFLDFIYPLSEDFFEGKVVLDAGCGMGRFLKLAAEFGCREIIGVDLSRSVDAAYQNVRGLENAHVVQADIMTLPFLCKFDYIFSIGVLHHMQDPKGGFSQLVKVLKENGTISAWVYSEENNGWVIHILSPIRNLITSRLPKSILYLLSYGLGLFLFSITKLVYKPANENRFGLKLGQWLPYNDYLYYSARLNYSSLVSVIFDHLVPQLAAYLPRDEFEAWFREAGLKDIKTASRNNMSWRGQGRRI